MTSRFAIIIIVVNFVLSLTLYLSSLFVLSVMNSYRPPVILRGFDAFSVYLAYSQTDSSPVSAIAWGVPNYPVYLLLVAVAVNLVFAIKLTINNKKKS